MNKPSLSYGYSRGCDYRVRGAQLTAECTMRVHGERRLSTGASATFEFETPFLGKPGVLATLAALLVCEQATGHPLDLSWFQAALRSPKARQPGRLEAKPLADGSLVVDDTYNANPASVRAAIEVAGELARLRDAKLHLVLGEMRELGPWSVAEHEALRAAIADCQPSSVVAIAGEAKRLLAGAPNEHFFETAAEAADRVVQNLDPGGVVLVKASRGVRAELVVEALERARGRR